MKIWEPFWSYQLNGTANSAHLPQHWAKLAVLFSWKLLKGSQDFDFSIAMDADCTFYVKSIETHVRALMPLNISAVGSVKTLRHIKKNSARIDGNGFTNDLTNFCQFWPTLFICPRVFTS